MSSTLPADYRQRVYAGWLGKCIGVRLGAPLENWTYDEIRRNLGEVTDFLPLAPGKLFKPDDDTAVPLILIRAVQEGAREAGEAMADGLRHVNDGVSRSREAGDALQEILSLADPEREDVIATLTDTLERSRKF